LILRRCRIRKLLCCAIYRACSSPNIPSILKAQHRFHWTISASIRMVAVNCRRRGMYGDSFCQCPIEWLIFLACLGKKIKPKKGQRRIQKRQGFLCVLIGGTNIFFHVRIPLRRKKEERSSVGRQIGIHKLRGTKCRR